MRPREHVLKAARLEATLERLDRSDDAEMIVEVCMLAATHLLNAALHVRGVTHGHSDQSHTIRPPLSYFQKSPEADLKEAMAPLASIEGLRPKYVRGGEVCGADIVEKCLLSFKDARARFMTIIGSAADPPAWE
ncbi:MAG: hypothetical protein HOC91_19595 [Nitrospinaceae bacterium]|jgi:hypothetical protein|nr:hypothetical protein [Nitrospinaceae bacterium]MBT3435031.1 hypothetical protein [Nitrospinaceae bacterium]MBT3820405.1 hypothetical protein [Nitrospinaceae bacterium]MBT4094309.1 hypothetical protein [Nitrospinaceae bacterium]MBT4432722.1 hypothetical protein [Nitrospinaceae bacterium]